ncbi:MAG: dihydroorotase [Planctomycetes bacterium]|nr:dihydroorotase [Planctomycetota bacterium]
MSQLLIHGGRVIDPTSGFDQTADVVISDDVVIEIDRVSPGRDVQRIDAEGCIVAPGLIDVHVHLREPHPDHEETIHSGCAAAINGGFTTICCMPNTQPPIDSAPLVELLRSKGERAQGARLFVAGCATKDRRGEQLAAIAGMAKAGAVAFTDDGHCVADAGLMDKVLRTVHAAGRCFMQHCQEPTLTQHADMNAGPLAAKLGLTGWPGVAEEIIIERDIRLNRSIGCRYHAQHLSSGDSVEIIRRARAEGQPVTAEVTPHHLLLTEDLCDGYNTMAKVNPPLRTTSDIDHLKAGVADGTITILATDHAPHPLHRKQVDFADAAFGIVGLDCALPLYIKALIGGPDGRGVIDWPAMLAMMTINPARLLGLDRMGLGALAVGGPADVTVIDPQLPWTIDPGEFASRGKNCPFTGWNVQGRAVATIVAGELRLMRAPARAET